MEQTGIPLDTPSFQSLQKIQYSVPSGNFGDVLAGFYAKQMGLPVHKFIVATNENNILDRFLKTGRYDKASDSSDPVKQTLSPAMDILISSNFERLLWYLVQPTDGSIQNKCSKTDATLACKQVNEYMLELKTSGGFQVSSKVLDLARTTFTSHCVDDAETTDTMKRYYHHQFSILNPTEKETCYILDPHTAVGVRAAEHILSQDKSTQTIQTICLSTASPGKFPDAVLNALNNDLPLESTQQGFKPVEFADIAPKKLVELTGLPQRMTVVKSNGQKHIGLEHVRKVIEQTL